MYVSEFVVVFVAVVIVELSTQRCFLVRFGDISTMLPGCVTSILDDWPFSCQFQRDIVMAVLVCFVGVDDQRTGLSTRRSVGSINRKYLVQRVAGLAGLT